MKKPHRISVAPVDGGWSLVCDANLAPMLFLSGGKAEAHARALARRLSEAGQDAEVIVRDRSREVIGSMRYHARELA